MRALIINGSARGAKGVTAKLAGALAEGLESGAGPWWTACSWRI